MLMPRDFTDQHFTLAPFKTFSIKDILDTNRISRVTGRLVGLTVHKATVRSHIELR